MLWNYYIDKYDIFFTIFYTFFIVLAAYFYKSKKISSDYRYKYFLPGLLVKILGGLVFGLIYQYYYRGGDTSAYFYNARLFAETLFENPKAYFIMLFQDAQSFHPDTYEFTEKMFYFRNPESWFMVKLTNFFALAGVLRYYSTTILFAVVSYIGLWKIFLVFCDLFRYVKAKYFAYLILYVPSVVFWGSGIMKDTVCITALGFLFYEWVNIVKYKKRGLLQFIWIVLATYVILRLKAYIIITFFPSLLFWLYLEQKNRIRNTKIRFVIAPFIFMVIVGSSLFAVYNFMQMSDFYKIDELQSRVQGFHSWHGQLANTRGQSGYDLGEIEYTPTGILQKFVPAVIVGLFRPFLIEVRNPVQIFAALENTVYLFLFLYLLVKTKFIGFFKLLKFDSLVYISVVFSILFAFVVGFTSYNFGALVRYKIPLLPFLGGALAVMWQLVNAKRVQNV
jgi:hypothetical protein